MSALAYEAIPNWGRLPAGWSLVEVAGIATDSGNNVYVFNRGEHPMVIFNEAGDFLHTWGEGLFQRPHGITMGPGDLLYLTDDKDHTVRCCTAAGEVLMTLGASGQPSDTGMKGFDYRTIERGGPPFHYPTNVALGANDEIFVTDGYGNARVHKFAADGTLLASWGEPGDGPGQFNLPHGIALDRSGRVIVADRENHRLQLFSQDGEFLEAWNDVVRPSQVFVDSENRIFVSELGMRCGLWPWQERQADAPAAGISIFDEHGRLLKRWGHDDPLAPDGFYAPHDVWLDSRGSIYIGEVIMSAGGYKGLIPPGCPCLRKYSVAS